MAFSDFLRPIEPGSGFHTYSHAAYVFRADAFKLHPKYQFLFWVRFKLNEKMYRGYSITENNKIIGALAKSVSLPKFGFETKTLNAYNRVNLVQTKIKYEPITIKFHDDGADVVRKFWYDYFAFYYRDSETASAPGIFSQAHKYNLRSTDQWGYSLANEDGSTSITDQAPYQYLDSIEIFSFHKKEFSQVTIHNPMITAFRHGEHDMSQGTGLLENEMTLAYETVSYATGYLSPTEFGDDMLLLYDNTPSPLTGEGTYNTIGPNGELVETKQPATDTVINEQGIPQQVTTKVTPYGSSSSMNTTSLGRALNSGNPAGSFLSQAGLGGLGGQQGNGQTNVLAKIGVGLATSMITNLMRGRKPNGKLNAPTISNLLYQAGGIAGGQLGAQLRAAGGLVKAGSAIQRGGIGPGNLGTAVVAINSAAAIFGKKPQDFLPGGFNRSVTTNGQSVGRPLYSSPSSMSSPFPAIGQSSVQYGNGGVQSVATPPFSQALAQKYNYSDSPVTINDSSNVTEAGDQGSFTI